MPELKANEFYVVADFRESDVLTHLGPLWWVQEWPELWRKTKSEAWSAFLQFMSHGGEVRTAAQWRKKGLRVVKVTVRASLEMVELPYTRR